MGERIAQLRRKRGLSQTKLAQALGLRTSTVAMYEQGRREPSVTIIIALARTLGVTIDYLLTGQSPHQSTLIPVSDSAPPRLVATILATAWHIGGQ